MKLIFTSKIPFFAGDARVLVREHPCAPLRAQDQEELDRDPGAVMEDDCGGGDPGAVVEIFCKMIVVVTPFSI